MEWKYRPDLLLALLVFGVFLMIGMRSGWPMFVVFFWIGPMLFRTFKHGAAWGQRDEETKRKNEDFAKAKNDEVAAEPVEYIMTNDGEVMEVIDDRPARRTNDLI